MGGGVGAAGASWADTEVAARVDDDLDATPTVPLLATFMAAESWLRRWATVLMVGLNDDDDDEDDEVDLEEDDEDEVVLEDDEDVVLEDVDSTVADSALNIISWAISLASSAEGKP